jgi:chromosome partitioning protein
MKTIIFTNQKGGVGKTTLTRELGITFSIWGYSVLLVDSDPQGNLTKSLADHSGPGLYEAFEEGRAEPVQLKNSLWLLAGDKRLAALEKRYLGDVDAYGKLSALFEDRGLSGYDLVLIDSPPSLGIMTLNGLAAADSFVIPLRPALYSLQGTNDLLDSVAKVKKSLNPGLELLGVVVNDFLPGPIISRQLRAEIEEGFGERVFDTVVSRTVKVEEAIASRTGVVEAPEGGSSKIAGEVTALAEEFKTRLGL